MKALKKQMQLRSKKDESEERDEPLASEDELDHEVGQIFSTKLSVFRIRIRGSSTGMMDPGPVMDPDPT